MTLVTQAVIFAAQAHDGAARKGSEIPYIVHPMEVVAIASTMTDDPQVLAAAALHDVMEDCGVTFETLSERFGVREQIDLGMTEDEWFKYAFDNSRLPEEISWGEYQEKGYYYPKLDPNWKDLPAGMRPFYEDPEANPLDTPTGKLEFWSQALADNFPDDKERTPMARWPGKRGLDTRRIAVGRALQEVSAAHHREPWQMARARAGRRHQVVP